MIDDRISKNIRLVYSALKKEGYSDIGSEQDFAKEMQSASNRKKVYDALTAAGYTDLGKDFDSFSGSIYTGPKRESVSSGASETAGGGIETNVAKPVVNTGGQQGQPQRQAQPRSQQTTNPLPSSIDFRRYVEPVLQPMPIFEQERSMDKDGNVVYKPKAVPTFEDGKMSSGYHDIVSGKYYDINDPNSESVVKNNTYTSEPFPGLANVNRRQVSGMASSIDNYLEEMRGAAVGARAKKMEEAADNGFWSSLLNATASTAGQASPTDIQSAGNLRAKYGDEETPEEKERGKQIRQLEAAQRSMRDAQRVIDEADHNAQEGTLGKWLESSFAGGAFRGFGQKLFDADTWDMGVSDGNDAMGIMEALKKADKGEPLSKAEQMLLDAKAVELATNAYFGSYVGHGYKAGEVTAESLPFMLEMCINPASGAGHGAQAMLTRYALKRFGKDAVKRNAKKYVAAKVASRVAGDLAGSMAMSATTGAGRVVAGAVERMNGDVLSDTDETTGESTYGGHTEGDSFGTALAKSFADTTIENYSEMVGEYFSPLTSLAGKYISKGMNKIGLKSVNDFIENVASSDVAKIVGDFERHSKWNGVFGEYAEEVAGNIMNSMIVGDMTLDTAEGTGVFNLDQNIDTFLGVGLMGGFMSGVKTLGYRTPKYRARKAMTAADDAAAATFADPSAWGDIRNTIAFGSDEEVKRKIASVVADGSLNDEQKRAALEYANKVEAYRGVLRGEDSRRSENPDSAEVDTETSYDNGYTLEADEEMNDAKNMYDFKREQLSGIVTGDYLAAFDDDPVGTLSEVMGRDDFSEDEKQLALDYVNAKATYDGMIDRVRDDIDSRIAASDKAVDSRVNKATGMIAPATLKLDDRKVYIVDGTVKMQDDGSMVDVSNSSESILVRDAETGKLEFMSPHDVLSTDEEIDPAVEKEAAQQSLREQYAQEQSDRIDGVLAFKVGDTYDLTDEHGQQLSAQIVADNGDGTVQVAWNGDPNHVSTVRKDELQSMRDNHNLARLDEYERQRAAQRQERQAEAAEPQRQEKQSGSSEAQRRTYKLNDEITLRDEYGDPVRGSITAEENEDGKIEVYTEQPVHAKQVQLLSRDELESMLLEHNGEQIVRPDSNNAPENVQQPTTADEPAAQTPEEKVIREGVAGVGEGLRDAVQEQAAGVRENDINQWLQRPEVAEALRKYGEGAESVEQLVQRALEDNPSDDAKAALNDLLRFDSSKKTAQQYVSQPPKPAASSEAEQPAPQPMPMIGEGEDADPDFARVTPQRAHEYIFNESGLDEEDAKDFMTNNLRAAETAVAKIKKKKPKMGTSIAKFNKEKAEWQRKLDEANANLDYWQRVKAERNAVLAERAKAQKEAEEKRIEEARAAEAAYREEMAKKESEQEALGANTVSPAIRDKWNAAPKVEGAQNEIVLANGEKVAGRYYLVESGAATPSHNSANGFAKSEGFPVDENGGSVNDRDYERDKDAQQITRDIANKYDSRAMQTPVVVSQDGVVLSGNGRTMAGELAAAQGTDGEYNEHLAKYPTQYGFTSEQVKGMQHPRVVFVPDAAMPYTADTFAKFNQQEMKGQSKTEHSVKLGKVVDDETFNRIIRLINRYDTLGDFYADFAACREAIGELFNCGAISRPQMAEMVDGDGLSAIGKETLENMLIGKAFESNPDAVRKATEFKQMRQTIIQALAEISNNISLGKDFSLESELADAVDLVYNARKSGYKAGERVSSYARQQQFDFYGVPSTVADYKNATMLMIADVLNDNRSTLLKKYLQLYNANAKDAANGQLDIFSGAVASKESILNDVNELLNDGTKEEQKKAAQEAVEKRKAESVAEAGVIDNGSEGSNEDSDRVEGAPSGQAATDEKGSKPVMSHDEKMAFMRQYLEDTGGDMRLLDVVSDEEVQKLLDLYDAWEALNDGLGAAHDANDALLKDEDKAIAQKAKENIEAAENAANAAFAQVEDYYNELQNTHNIEDEEGDADETETPSAETPLSDAVSAAEAETDQNPTDGQKEAGNYKKGHVQVGTFDITIENPKGSVRRGKDANGKEWESKMNNTYGYFRGTEGVDGDHIDVFISNDIDGWDGRKVFVVDQYNPDGNFDEHKVMLGFNDADDAKSEYLANYEKGWENGRRIDVSAVNLEDFEKWIASSKRKTKPFGEYSSVKKETVGNSFDDFVRDSRGEVIPNGVTRSNVINFAERVLEKYPSHTESYGTYNAKRTDVEIPADKLFKSESDWFTAKNGNSIAVNDTQAKACYELVAHKDAQGHLKSVSVIKYHSFDNALTDEEVVVITDAMKANATVAPTVEINDANWKESVDTPIGAVKMGENQKAKLFAKGREQQYGMLLETLSNPDVVLEEKDKEQNMFHERPSSCLFVKTFQKEDGSKFVHFESVTVSQEGMEVSISSHIIRENQLKNKLKSDRLLYKATALDAPANTSAEQPIVGGSLSSDGKVTEKDSFDKENGVKSYKITPKEYTTKRGKKLSMHLVSPNAPIRLHRVYKFQKGVYTCLQLLLSAKTQNSIENLSAMPINRCCGSSYKIINPHTFAGETL